MPLIDARRIPTSTYRVQLHSQFPFRQVEGIIPYLRALGVGDVYSSPIFSSPPGSTHGYDVGDYRTIDAELGGDRGLEELAGTLGKADMGLLVDFVPNHMGIRGPFNPWWLDVLEHGRKSRYAHYFDIQWRGANDTHGGRVLVPVLDGPYGVVLENGGLKLKYQDGGLRVCFGENYFPLRPSSAAGFLESAAADPECSSAHAAELLAIAGGFRRADLVGTQAGDFSDESMSQLAPAKRRLARLMDSDSGACQFIVSQIQRLNGQPGIPGSFDSLDGLLDQQHYRLAHWKTGIFAANYRRFFAIDSLIGVRMEEPDVFGECHALVGKLLKSGEITGLRIDHIDGLWDAQEYLERLQSLPAPRGAEGPTFVVVEKILEGNETLPKAWPVHGTTGYEFIAQCGRLFVDSRNEAQLTRTYHEFAGAIPAFEDLAYQKKRLVLTEMFANTVTLLADRLSSILSRDRRQRDLTHRELVLAIREMMASLPVYRTYRRADAGLSGAEAETMHAAFRRATRENPGFDADTLKLIHDVVVGLYPPAGTDESYRRQISRWVLSFQQYTGAVMAKALEDTAFYVYNRLVALNEVGGDPGRFGGPLEEFHSVNLRRLEQTPHSLVATSTHDTKMSEDVRARLYTLSEIPGEWEAWVREWREINRVHKSTVDGQESPDPNEEYRLYQILLGAWPLDDSGSSDAFRARIRDHVRKAVNEAKMNTTWIKPNGAWLEAGDRFINSILSASTGKAFLHSFIPKASRIAEMGMVNSLAQLVLKVTSPGIPDFYQGNETWDFSLVDPDNRRAVDFDLRQKLLDSFSGRTPGDLLSHWRDGTVKVGLTQRLLHLRRSLPELFASGNYQPLATAGTRAENVVAFARSHAQQHLIVLVPRHCAGIGTPPIGAVWGETTVALPSPGTEWTDAISKRRWKGGERARVADLFAEYPLAVAYSTKAPLSAP